MLGVESLAVSEYVYSVLHGDAVLMAMLGQPDPFLVPGAPPADVYEDTVPSEATYPYVTYSQTAPDRILTTYNGIEVLDEVRFTVKAVDRAESYNLVGPIASRIYFLLHRTSGSVADGVILFSERVGNVRVSAIIEETSYRHLGGVYRFWTQGQ